MTKPTAEDTQLARLLAAWPELPEHIRAAILVLADAGARSVRAPGMSG